MTIRLLVGCIAIPVVAVHLKLKSEKIGQSSHKMYSNNIVNFQESTTILNACKKKVWKLIEGTTYQPSFFYLMPKPSLLKKQNKKKKKKNTADILSKVEVKGYRYLYISLGF